MKRCSKCGKTYEDWSIFCRDCGQLLSPEGEAAPTPAQAESVLRAQPEEETLLQAAAPPPPEPEAPAAPTPPQADAPQTPAVPGRMQQPGGAPQPEAPQTPAAVPPPQQPSQGPFPYSGPYDPIPDMFKEAPPEPKVKKPRPLRDGSLPKLGFGRGLAYVLAGILLFLLLAAPLGVYIVRESSTEAGLNTLLADVRLSQIPAGDVIRGADPQQTVSGWLGDKLFALSKKLDFTTEAVADFLDRSSLKDSAVRDLAAVLRDWFAGSGEHALGKAEYRAMIVENQGLFEDVFHKELPTELTPMLADLLVSSGLPTLPTQAELRQANPTLSTALQYGFSWVTVIVLLLLAVLVFLLLCKLARGVLRPLRSLGILLCILGGLTALAAGFAKLLPDLWSGLLQAGYVPGKASAALLGSQLPIFLGMLGLGVLLLVLVRLIRAGQARRAAKRLAKAG
ncbi:MAG: hypothetical protein IKP82_02720 [Oscillospiraceae bacterium]|nr:hypothetical protein [Oscillospiraceae bacterium]